MQRVEDERTRTSPPLPTADETADLLRTTRKAGYAMVERGAVRAAAWLLDDEDRAFLRAHRDEITGALAIEGCV